MNTDYFSTDFYMVIAQKFTPRLMQAPLQTERQLYARRIVLYTCMLHKQAGNLNDFIELIRRKLTSKSSHKQHMHTCYTYATAIFCSWAGKYTSDPECQEQSLKSSHLDGC